MDWAQLAFRWLHVIAGVMWIGHLWFFNFVNGPLAKTYDADSKKKVIPELMPRALYWFRWGAAFTFLTGICLLGMVYYMTSKQTIAEGKGLSDGMGGAIGLGLIIVGFAIYDVMWKSLAKKEMVGGVISFLLVTGIAFGLGQVFTGRAVFIHIGALFGTIMAANVWMRIWPNQRKIIAAIKDGKAPDAALVATAGLRSKHNTYMSMPLIFFMVSNHYPTVYGMDQSWVVVPVFVALGWGIAKFCYNKAASATPVLFMPAGATEASSAEAAKK
jgi:uncharacterized membrane protein